MNRSSDERHDRPQHLRPRDLRRPRRCPTCTSATAGPPPTPLGTPEGHAIRCNGAGDVIGVTIVNARCLLDRDGKITITIPERIDVSAAALAPAMASPFA